MNNKEIPNGINITEQAESGQIKNLLESFWGKDSNIANYQQEQISYTDARELLDSALSNPNNKNYVQSTLTGKRIPLTAVDPKSSELIAHSSLLIFADTVEASGSIIKDSHRGKGILRNINVYRRELLERFAKLDYDLTSYLTIGSPSVDYGQNLFNFSNIDMESVFCNIAPFILKINPTDLSRQDARLLDWSMQTDQGLRGSTTQILGLKRDNPPIVDQSNANQLPEATKSLLTLMPKRFVTDVSTPVRENQFYATSASMDIYNLYSKLPDINVFYENMKNDKRADRSVLLRVPIRNGTGNVMEQINTLVDLNNEDYRLVPTGLTVVDGYWAGCYALMSERERKAFKNVADKLSNAYTGSLKNVADMIKLDLSNN